MEKQTVGRCRRKSRSLQTREFGVDVSHIRYDDVRECRRRIETNDNPRSERTAQTRSRVPKNTRGGAYAHGHGIPNDDIKSRYEFLEGTLPDASRDAIFENRSPIQLAGGIVTSGQ